MTLDEWCKNEGYKDKETRAIVEKVFCYQQLRINKLRKEIHEFKFKLAPMLLSLGK